MLSSSNFINQLYLLHWNHVKKKHSYNLFSTILRLKNCRDYKNYIVLSKNTINENTFACWIDTIFLDSALIVLGPWPSYSKIALPHYLVLSSRPPLMEIVVNKYFVDPQLLSQMVETLIFSCFDELGPL